MPVRSNSKISCIWTWSCSMPVTSAMATTRRAPSLRRAICTTMLMAEASWARITLSGTCWLAIMTMVSRREKASRAALAWTVVMEPSWPVFMACNISSASAPRDSPTMMRSGPKHHPLTYPSEGGSLFRRGAYLHLHEVIWKDRFVEKILDKHGVTTDEVEDVVFGNPHVRL